MYWILFVLDLWWLWCIEIHGKLHPSKNCYINLNLSMRKKCQKKFVTVNKNLTYICEVWLVRLVFKFRSCCDVILDVVWDWMKWWSHRWSRGNASLPQCYYGISAHVELCPIIKRGCWLHERGGGLIHLAVIMITPSRGGRYHFLSASITTTVIMVLFNKMEKVC